MHKIIAAIQPLAQEKMETTAIFPFLFGFKKQQLSNERISRALWD